MPASVALAVLRQSGDRPDLQQTLEQLGEQLVQFIDGELTLLLDPEERAAEKQASRDKDAADLASGAKTREQLREKNSHFRDVAHDPIQWDKTKL